MEIGIYLDIGYSFGRIRLSFSPLTLHVYARQLTRDTITVHILLSESFLLQLTKVFDYEFEARKRGSRTVQSL